MRRRAENFIRWSPAFLLAACLTALSSLAFAPFSPMYVGAAAAVGLAYTVLALTCWKLERYQPFNWVVFIPTIWLVVWGRDWAERAAFPEAGYHSPGWWLAAQYVCIVFAVYFAALFIFKSLIKRFLFGGSSSSESLV